MNQIPLPPVREDKSPIVPRKRDLAVIVWLVAALLLSGLVGITVFVICAHA